MPDEDEECADPGDGEGEPEGGGVTAHDVLRRWSRKKDAQLRCHDRGGRAQRSNRVSAAVCWLLGKVPAMTGRIAISHSDHLLGPVQTKRVDLPWGLG